MKNHYAFIYTALLLPVFGWAQSQSPLHSQFFRYEAAPMPTAAVPEATVLWSEDFTNGIPANWENVVLDINGQPTTGGAWEYRGPQTSPSAATGSRGQYGMAQPLVSPTASNGFVIFDSDYNDNGGTPNFGSGPLPGPHHAILTSPTINLSGQPSVGLRFSQYARWFRGPFNQLDTGAAFLQFSTNGGQTWSALVPVDFAHKAQTPTPNGQEVVLNVSTYIGNQSQARIRFVFKGFYYAWMLDDVALFEMPPHALRFVKSGNAQPVDFYLRGSSLLEHRRGQLNRSGCAPGYFSATIENYGASPQTGVRLEVSVLDANNTQIFSSDSRDTLLLSGHVGLPQAFTAQFAWNTCLLFPSSHDSLKIVFKAVSDSMQTSNAQWFATDTLLVNFTDSILGQHLSGPADNRIGTNADLGLDGIGVATLLCDVGTTKPVRVRIPLEAGTVPGGRVEVALHAEHSFDLSSNSFIVPPFFDGAKVVTAADIAAGEIVVDLVQGIQGLTWPSSACGYVVAQFYSNNGAHPIFIGNKNRLEHNENSVLFQYNTPNFQGWARSHPRVGGFESPVLNLVFCSSFGTNQQGCLLSDENISGGVQLQVAPNPTTGKLVLKGLPERNQLLKLTLRNAMGQAVWQEVAPTESHPQREINVSHLPEGMYYLEVALAEEMKVLKVLLVR